MRTNMNYNAAGTRKRYRIKSRTRFTIFIIVMILIAMSIIGYITGINTAHGSTMEQYATVEITNGDTLWSIADEYAPEGTDLREFIYEIKELNGLDTSNIMIGQVIRVPMY